MSSTEPAFRSKLPGPVAAPDTEDPTFRYRRGLANISEAVMHRVIELEAEAERLTEIAKKLRAAVVANT